MSDPILNEKPLVENHCPCGCDLDDLDEHGYCRHLIGFSNDRKTFERQIRNDRGLRQVDATEKISVGRYKHKLEKLDKRKHKLVNPSRIQIDRGVQHTAYKWLSWRVYDESVPQETPCAEMADDPEEVSA